MNEWMWWITVFSKASRAEGEECSTGTIQWEQKPALKLSSAFYQMLVFQTIRGEETIATGEASVWGRNITEASVCLFILSARREEMK